MFDEIVKRWTHLTGKFLMKFSMEASSNKLDGESSKKVAG